MTRSGKGSLTSCLLCERSISVPTVLAARATVTEDPVLARDLGKAFSGEGYLFLVPRLADPGKGHRWGVLKVGHGAL